MLLSILAFLTVLIVINSTLFTLQKVSINWLTTKYMIDLNGTKDYNITDEVDVGGSIFMLQKDDISAHLEKEFPYLRVVSIETKFPNKLVIHSAERESLYAVSMGNNMYAILDEMGKVLAKSSYKKIFEGDDFVSVSMRKGGATNNHEVDAISGGTKTCDGVNAMLKSGIEGYLPYINANKSNK